MNPPKKHRNRTRKKIRTSRHAHLWPELALMPWLDHWPDRPATFKPECSQVLAFIVDGNGCDLREAERIFQSARHAGVIKFNPATHLWHGRKGGRP